MIRKILPSAVLLTATFTTYSQDTTGNNQSAKTTTLSGFVDVYYRFNLANPSKTSGVFNNYTSFTNSQNSFELGMASVKLEHNAGKVGVVADVGFGKRAEEFSYNDANTRFAIKQANVTYAPDEHIRFTAGSWATHVGYEVVDPINRNYSMSYMFSYGPFAHIGVKTELSIGNSALMIGIANPTDLKSADFSKKFFIAQYSFVTADERFKSYLNFQKGQANDSLKTQQIDLVTTTTLSDKFSMGFNGTLVHSKYRLNGKFDPTADWWGTALYLNFDPTSTVSFTLRGEYFSDERAASGGAFGANIFATTLSANLKVGELTIIPELRFDNATSGIFINSGGDAVKSTSSVLIAAVYKF